MLWIKKSTALRSCFLSHINDTRLSMDKFQQALAGVFVRGSFPPVGTNPRLPVLPALLDFSMHKNSPNIVYRFHNEIIEITLEDYLKENPDKTEHDFAELKALSDQIYYEQDRAESAQTRKDVSIHGLEETEHCATRALDEEWEERVVDIQNRKYAWKAFEQLFTVGALTEGQKRRFRLHVFQGLSTRQIGRMEGTSHQAVAKSINLAIAKLKKYFAAQG